MFKVNKKDQDYIIDIALIILLVILKLFDTRCELEILHQCRKRLKLKVRKFLGLISTFVEVPGKKLVEGPFCPPPFLNRVKKG